MCLATCDFKQGLYFGKLTAYVTDEDTVNLMGSFVAKTISATSPATRPKAMVAGSGPIRTAFSCSGATMPAISSTS